jgi:chitosanase
MDDKQFCACLGKTCGGDTVKDSSGRFHPVYCGGCQPPAYCAAFATIYGGALGTCSAGGGLDAIQKQKAEMMTSIWENNTPVLQYGYSQDIGDGRGYTSGRAGFCTGTGDGILVIECYDLAEPGNAMQKYMPALVTINDAFAASGGTQIQSSKAGLSGWPGDWKASASDPVFRDCQDGVSDAVYYGSALRHAAQKKFATALTKAVLYDSMVNQGEADPRFGVITMMAGADGQVPVSDPPALAEEDGWLKAFLAIRLKIMQNDPTWRSNTYRVTTYEKLRAAGNWDLSQCIVTDSSVFTIKTAGTTATATSGAHCP